ncbi:MAG: hypothetical protein LBN32_02120 [Helicobacteraceae bacterium]|jgi:hypothetical protein|nr:hypothetical protein [Helicobacteraceae bacterium]
MRLLMIVLLAIGSLFANTVDDKVRNLVDPQSYIVHKNLIDFLFRDHERFMIAENRANSVKIAATLKENGLLDIFYKNAPRNLSATFRTTHGPFFVLKVIADSLAELGYNYTLISNMRYDSLFFEWTLSYRSDHAIDPSLLAKKLETYRIVIDDISKRKDEWFYTLDTFHPTLSDASRLDHAANDPLFLQAPSGEYWVALPYDAKRLSARKKSGGAWFTSAVFYDDKLNILRVETSKSAVKTFETILPKNTMYMKITDNHVPSNLRNGVWLWVEK